MKYKTLWLGLLSLSLLTGCDQIYTRSLDGLVLHLSQSEFLSEFKEIPVSMGFSPLGERSAAKQGVLISEYSRRDTDSGREIGIALYLKDSVKNGGRFEISIVVGAGGVEKGTKVVVDRVFDAVLSGMKSCFDHKFQITKASEPW